MTTLLEQWDRATGTMYKLAPRHPLVSLSDGDNHDAPSSKQTHLPAQSHPKRGKSRKETKEAHAGESASAETPSITEGSEANLEEKKEGIGVPVVQIDGKQSETTITDSIMAAGLPSLTDILDGMGVGPNGPPLPPPTKFAVIPYPSKRSTQAGSTHYTFVSTSADDPNVAEEGKQKSELESESQQLSKVVGYVVV